MREPEPIRARLRGKSFSAFCKIWARREAKGDPVLVGKFFLDGRSVTFEVGPGGSDEQMKRLMAEPNWVGGDRAFLLLKEDPACWFCALPLTYHGFRLWAGKIQERAASTAKLPDRPSGASKVHSVESKEAGRRKCCIWD